MGWHAHLGIVLLALTIVLALAITSGAQCKGCTTIQSGELLASDGSVITTGFDQWGYNYQGHMFKGGYCDAYRDAAWCQDDKEDELLMNSLHAESAASCTLPQNRGEGFLYEKSRKPLYN